MFKPQLWTITEVGEILGLSRQTTSELATKLGVEFKPMINGKAKGLDIDDIRRLRKALGMKGPFGPTAAVAAS